MFAVGMNVRVCVCVPVVCGYATRITYLHTLFQFALDDVSFGVFLLLLCFGFFYFGWYIRVRSVRLTWTVCVCAAITIMKRKRSHEMANSELVSSTTYTPGVVAHCIQLPRYPPIIPHSLECFSLASRTQTPRQHFPFHPDRIECSECQSGWSASLALAGWLKFKSTHYREQQITSKVP